MKEIIKVLAEIVNQIHDVLIVLFGEIGIQLTDKELHFWIIGFIGIITFLFVYVCFKWLEKLKVSTTIFSFIYTFTVMVVLVFAIEIQQAITNRGNMEFADAVIGLYGFLAFFFAYALVALAIYFIRMYYQKKKEKTKAQQTLTEDNNQEEITVSRKSRNRG